MSAQPCGCDPEERYRCEKHTRILRDAAPELLEALKLIAAGADGPQTARAVLELVEEA